MTRSKESLTSTPNLNARRSVESETTDDASRVACSVSRLPMRYSAQHEPNYLRHRPCATSQDDMPIT
jgi:hypothetical protein